jgi:hypothetical protein
MLLEEVIGHLGSGATTENHCDSRKQSQNPANNAARHAGTFVWKVAHLFTCRPPTHPSVRRRSTIVDIF